MTSIITPPLAAYFIWHGSDQKAFDEVCGDFRSYLTRDIDRPFSRELNIPTFFFSGYDHPPKQPNYFAQNNVIFICLSRNTLGNVLWRTFLNNIIISKTAYVVPIALDQHGMKHTTEQGSLNSLNCIRAFNFEEENKNYYLYYIYLTNYIVMVLTSINLVDMGLAHQCDCS